MTGAAALATPARRIGDVLMELRHITLRFGGLVGQQFGPDRSIEAEIVVIDGMGGISVNHWMCLERKVTNFLNNSF